MITVGLTGGIGSGKSTVSTGLVERGAVLIDADAITRQLQQRGMPVFEAMVEQFGDGIVAADGSLDRAAVAAIVFTDADALSDLNSIVHPAVGETIAKRLAEHADTGSIVILDIPLLAEGRDRGAKPRYQLEAVLVVDCPADLAVRRLVEFRGFDEADALRRVSAQASRTDRVAMADFVVENAGSLEDLTVAVDGAWSWMIGLG